MLAVQPLPSQSHEMSMESPSMQEVEPQLHSSQKTQIKSSRFSAYKIVIGVALLFIVALVGYKLLSLAYAGSAVSQINGSHSKFIQNGDSSSGKDSGSTSGNSQSSKTSRDSSKPMGISSTAGKGVISSQGSSTGSSGDGEGEDPNEDEDNDGEKRKKHMRDNKMSDGSSTEEDSELSDEEDEEENSEEEVEGQGMSYNPGSSLPIVGGTRP